MWNRRNIDLDYRTLSFLTLIILFVPMNKVCVDSRIRHVNSVGTYHLVPKGQMHCATFKEYRSSLQLH